MTIDRAAVEAVAVLDEPVRRALYEWLAGRSHPVGRDEAAAAVGISRALAAFHLDRMVREGLFVTESRRLTGRSGAGAGRPAKLYRRAPGTIAVSLPQRGYELVAHILADALERSSRKLPPPAARTAAHEAGHSIGRAARERAGRRLDRRARTTALLDALRERGYEPRIGEHDAIALGNCPFDALVDEHRPLVCGMNLALSEGVLEGLGERRLRAELDQAPDRCCVRFRAVSPLGAASVANRASRSRGA